MLRSLYTAATGMEAEQLKMDTIANNLANVNTTGFKRTRAEFQDLLSETIVQAQPAGPDGGGQPGAVAVGLRGGTGRPGRSVSAGAPAARPARWGRGTWSRRRVRTTSRSRATATSGSSASA